MIKAIDKNIVYQICSGQVVLTLATAVKELVENSVDAGATSIQVKLVEYGSEMIEVTDNGSGVEENNLEGMTLKHHTSKLRDFADLESVDTFGFRGEALSSLCSLGSVKITTRHASMSVGTKMTFDHQGMVREVTSVARQVGTTVSVENLFYTLPVRHKEFLRNIKKEFAKLCTVLQAYSLFNQHCRLLSIVRRILIARCSITCVNRVGDKNRTVLDVRIGCLKERISALFGTKQLGDLLEFPTIKPDEDIQNEFRCKVDDGETVALVGFISSCGSGAGRSSPDRQFIFINSRPVDNAKITRLTNEVYRQYNPHQYPFIVLNIITTGSLDVNLVPDKRKILLEHENLVLATVKMSMQHLFKNIPSMLPLHLGRTLKPETLSHFQVPVTSNGRFGLGRFKAAGYVEKVEEIIDERCIQKKIVPTTKISRFLRPLDNEDIPSAKKPRIGFENSSENLNTSDTIEDTSIEETITSESMDEQIISNTMKCEEIKEILVVHKNHENEPSLNTTILRSPGHKNEISEENIEPAVKITNNKMEVDSGITTDDVSKRRQAVLDVSCCKIVKSRESRTYNVGANNSVKFFAKIEPGANERAEKELTRELSQEAFQLMQVVGQFNRGFIITKLASDLFIIDQHATDEKANFELLSSKKMTQQRLAVPQQLHLSADKEELFLDRADVIKMNGFDFVMDLNACVTRRVTLTCIPLLERAVFDRSDLDQLLFLLSDAPDGQQCRASRGRDVLASRACRMSVMIGAVLKTEEMSRIVQHMGQMDQPWNCPHGRPTIRHLVNLQLLHDTSRDNF